MPAGSMFRTVRAMARSFKAEDGDENDRVYEYRCALARFARPGEPRKKVARKVVRILNRHDDYNTFKLCVTCCGPDLKENMRVFHGSEGAGMCRTCASEHLTTDRNGLWVRTEDTVLVYPNMEMYRQQIRAVRYLREDADEDWYRVQEGAWVEDYTRPDFLHKVHDYHATSSQQKLLPDEHTARSAKFFGAPFYMGLELEMYAKRSIGPVSMCKLIAPTGGVDRKFIRGFEHDGSLNEDPDNALEMVTNATSREALTDWLINRFPRGTGGKSHDTTTCGLHVHVTRECLSTAHQFRLIRFFAEPLMQEFITEVARREPNTFNKRPVLAQAKVNGGNYGRTYYLSRTDCSSAFGNMVYASPVRMPGPVQPMQNPPMTRRELLPHSTDPKFVHGFDHGAVDFTHNKTVEFRLFKGSLKPETIVAALEFTWMVVMFTRHAPRGNLDGYKPDKFIEFVNHPRWSRDTKYLRPYLKVIGQRGVRTPAPCLVDRALKKDADRAAPVPLFLTESEV